MAIVRLGPALTDARGSIGGVVFSRTRAGIICRSRIKPIYRETPRQTTISTNLTNLSDTWQSAAMNTYRAGWDALATNTSLSNAVGMDFQPTGMNLYIRANMNLLQAARAQVTTAPTSSRTTGCPFTVVYSAQDGINVSAIGSFEDAGTGSVLIYVSTPHSKGINYFKGPFSSLQVKLDTAFATLPLVVIAAASCVAASAYVLKMVHVLPTGECSPPELFRVLTP